MPKTVLITGAARGIGLACAQLYAEHGYNVAIHYHTSRRLAEQLAEELRQKGCNAQCFMADVMDAEQTEAMVAAVTDFFGHIDVVVCNAGIAQQKLFTEITNTEWDKMLHTNVNGAFYVCRAVLPQMIQRKKGSIVVVSSIWGRQGASCEVHYSASKAALIGMAKALAKEVAPSGITVNCVAPGVIDTQMCACFDAQTMAALAQETPMGRIGKPRDVAEAVYFLSSEKALFITGQVLGVDGGFGW